MKSRTASNARRLAANEPAEAGRCSMRMPSTRSMIKEESLTSARLLARSTKRPRRVRSTKSPSSTTTTPAASTHSVSNAWLGTTRSYTFMMNSGIATANRLVRNAASSTSRYRPAFSAITPQNQWPRRTPRTMGERASKCWRGRT